MRKFFHKPLSFLPETPLHTGNTFFLGFTAGWVNVKLPSFSIKTITHSEFDPLYLGAIQWEVYGPTKHATLYSLCMQNKVKHESVTEAAILCNLVQCRLLFVILDLARASQVPLGCTFDHATENHHEGWKAQTIDAVTINLIKFGLAHSLDTKVDIFSLNHLVQMNDQLGHGCFLVRLFHLLFGLIETSSLGTCCILNCSTC